MKFYEKPNLNILNVEVEQYLLIKSGVHDDYYEDGAEVGGDPLPPGENFD